MTGDPDWEETADLSAILKSDLFSNLLPGERQSVLERTGSVLLRKGGILFSPGKKAEHLFLLRRGRVRVFRPAGDGEDEEIARFTQGDVIGDFDFARDAEYDARAEALEDCSLVMFPGYGQTLDNFALEAPHLVSKILLNAAAMVTGRIKASRKLIAESMSWVKELHRQIYEDPGTGLWKMTFLTEETNRFAEKPMALIMLKPDRFKILVDVLGHRAGDRAMIKIAAILKNHTRRLGRGWALRFRSNETGIVINECEPSLAESVARDIFNAVAGIPPVPLEPGENSFSFSGSVAWGIWPDDGDSWELLFKNTYDLLMDTWKAGGNKIVRTGAGKSS